MRRKNLRIKEDWQESGDGKKDGLGRAVYGKHKMAQFPLSLADELEKAAKEKGVSQSRFIIESVAMRLGIDLENC